MKSPFRYQISDVDCFPTTIINAVTYFFPMEKISGELIKMIYCFSLDDISDKGKTKGRIQGTKSNTVLEKLNSFVEITVDILKSEDVNLRKIEACLKKGGVAICSIYDSDAKKGCGHSVLVIDCDNEWVYIWDPYPYTKLMPEVDFTEYGKSPQKANIKITRKRFDSYKVKPFSLGEKDRECCLMYRKIS